MPLMLPYWRQRSVMETIYTPKGEPILVDDEDYERLNKYTWNLDKDGYAFRQTKMPRSRKCIRIRMHREVMGIPYRDPRQVDHRYGIKTDNRKSQLRICDNKQNHWNVGAPCSNTSGHKGVDWVPSRGKWRARICINRKRYCLGHFNTAEEAAEAYRKAAIEMQGEFFHASPRIHEGASVLAATGTDAMT
jgi:hypothetical protein